MVNRKLYLNVYDFGNIIIYDEVFHISIIFYHLTSNIGKKVITFGIGTACTDVPIVELNTKLKETLTW